VKPNRLTVAEYLEQWLQGHVATNTAPKTHERYEEIVRIHLIPALGSLPLSALQPQHIQKYYAEALESGRRDGKGGLSARTVHHHHRVLFEALRHAVKHGIIVRNPADAVDPPRPQNKEITMMGPSDVRLLLDAAKPTPYYVAFFTAVYTGLRRGELLGLRWCDVDLDLATLSIMQTLQQLRNRQYVFREPKSRRGRRQIALSPSLAVLLREHRATQEEAQKLLGKALAPSDLVFSHPDGTPLRPDSVTRTFHRMVRALGLDGIRFHDLRHAHATIMLRQGVHPKIVSERLGHSTVAITLDTYSHVLPGLQEAAACRFEEGLQQTVDMPATVP
jgi:integrase